MPSSLFWAPCLATSPTSASTAYHSISLLIVSWSDIVHAIIPDALTLPGSRTTGQRGLTLAPAAGDTAFATSITTPFSLVELEDSAHAHSSVDPCEGVLRPADLAGKPAAGGRDSRGARSSA